MRVHASRAGAVTVSRRAGGLAKLKICQRLEEEYEACKAKESEAEQLVEQKLKALSDVAMRSLDTRKRNFLVSIFAKGGPEAKNAYFIRWKAIYLMYAKSYKVWKGFFGKLQNMKVNMVRDAASFRLLTPSTRLASIS